MKNLVTESPRELSGSGSKSASFRPAATAASSANRQQTPVNQTGAPAVVVVQSRQFDVLGGPDKGGFDVLGGPDKGGFDVLGGPDKGGFDVLGGPDNGGFDVLGRADVGGFDVLGYRR
jgi:hypothetical protein